MTKVKKQPKTPKTLSAADFAGSLTMAELAIYEASTGAPLGDDEIGLPVMVSNLAQIAARRLGHNITADDAAAITLDAAQRLFARAAGQTSGEGISKALAALMSEIGDDAGEQSSDDSTN
jgi:hypothetical protein